jgi:hypothetical protein
MKEPEPTALAFLQASARELREHFDHEISERFPTYSMWHDVYTLKAASMAEWRHRIRDAFKRYQKDAVKAAVYEIMAHDANYYRLTHA